MFRKPVPSDTEIDAMAEQFKMLWKPGQAIRPYLRKHAQMFRGLLRDEWSWAGLALALTKAGITYQTEKPWSANALMQAFSRAQLPLKGYSRRKDSASNTNEPPPESNVRAALPAPNTQAAFHPMAATDRATTSGLTTGAEPIPKFKPFSLKAQEPPREPSPGEIEEREAIRIRMFGK